MEGGMTKARPWRARSSKGWKRSGGALPIPPQVDVPPPGTRLRQWTRCRGSCFSGMETPAKSLR
jgi:hypothetical protein